VAAVVRSSEQKKELRGTPDGWLCRPKRPDAKLPEETKELDQVLTSFITEVKATTVQTKMRKDE
jgi:hypothetical protein